MCIEILFLNINENFLWRVILEVWIICFVGILMSRVLDIVVFFRFLLLDMYKVFK